MIDARTTRDLPLDFWGPYSKHHAGYSHIVPDGDGAMMDLIPLVGRDRGRTIVPDVNFESSYHVTAALPDLSYISYRYQLRWKDVETADVEFVRRGDDVLCRITYANNGEAPTTFVTSLMSVFRPFEQVALDLPEGYAWIGGERYVDLRPADNAIGWVSGEHYEGNDSVRQLRLGKDGLRKGITVSPLFVAQLALGTVPPADLEHGVSANRAFVFHPGTTVRYDLAAIAGRPSGALSVRVRYRMEGVTRLALTLRSGESRADVELRERDSDSGNKPDRRAPCVLSPSVVLDPTADEITLEVTALDAGEEPFFAIDGFLVGPVPEDDGADRASEADARGSGAAADPFAWFAAPPNPPRFAWERDEGHPGVLLESNEAPGYRFYLESADERPVPPAPYSDATITHVYHSELAGASIERKLSNDSLFNWYHVNCTIHGDGENHFLGYNLGPLVVQPGERRVVDVAICAGSSEPTALRERAGMLLAGAEPIVDEARVAYAAFDTGDAPSEYAFGVRTLRHYTVSNVTYPIRIGEEVVRTYTPGRRWGGLFTWDSGMHGIGLTEYAPDRAAGILDQYLPRSQSDEVPVVLHGTPLPLHVYLLAEISRHDPNPELLRRYYRRALLYWSYFAGLHPDSTYDAGGIGMLCSYSDGYNSLGVDDYPVQHYAGTAGLYGQVKTVSTTAHAIRAAKILRDLASRIAEDTDELTARIDYLSHGLQEHSWNPDTGWFEHVLTDTLEPVLTPDGQSFNMGFDGVAPLVAGVCTDEQRRTLVDHVMSEREMWTPHGITAVSQSAPYFRTDGYWNGKIWIPHQWFLWRAMITEGEFDHAATIATTALGVFDRAARASYCSWELFDSRSGMGEGCHQFGGLSAPLAAFHNAYFQPGRFTPGFDTLVVQRSGARGGVLAAGSADEHWVDLEAPSTGRLRGIIRVSPGVVPVADGEPLEQSPTMENVYRLDRSGVRCRVAWSKT